MNPQFLDGLRGLAALYVLLHHARGLAGRLWLGIEPYHATAGSPVDVVLANVTGLFRFGEAAVLLFFLISGFCIHYRQAKQLATGPVELNVRHYAWRRFRRLYPTLLVALALTGLCWTLGSMLNPDFYRGHSGYWWLDESVFQGVEHMSPAVLASNLLMQGSILSPVFGTNTPLWSLGMEVWFYALYPVLLRVIARFGAGWMMLTAGCVSGAAFGLRQILGQHDANWIAVGPEAWIPRVLSYWVVWAAGAWIAEMYVGRSRRVGGRWMPIAGALLLVGQGTVVIRNVQLPFDPEPYVWAAGLWLLLAHSMLNPSRFVMQVEKHLRGLLKFFGNISYSLYVVHFPVMMLLASSWIAAFGGLPYGAELALVAVPTSLVVATLSWCLVERHTMSSGQGASLRSGPVDRELALGVSPRTL